VAVAAVAVVAVEADEGGLSRAEGGLGAASGGCAAAGDENGEDLVLAWRCGAGDESAKGGERKDEAAGSGGGAAATGTC
jgi:hypothetical protein